MYDHFGVAGASIAKWCTFEYNRPATVLPYSVIHQQKWQNPNKSSENIVINSDRESYTLRIIFQFTVVRRLLKLSVLTGVEVFANV